MNSQYFPPTESDIKPAPVKEDTPTPAEEAQSAELLAAKLPDPPTSDPVVPDERNPKKPKLDSAASDIHLLDRDEERSEDDWEKVDEPDCVTPTERLDDEPVEIAKAPTAADVRSVVSSVADLGSSTELKGGD